MTTQEILEAARASKTAVALANSETRRQALLAMADRLCLPENMEAILAANAEDMAAAKGHISEVMLDRLALTEERIDAMGRGILEVAALPDPVGRVLRRVERPNGLVIEKTSVPMGVIAIIYEIGKLQLCLHSAAIRFPSAYHAILYKTCAVKTSDFIRNLTDILCLIDLNGQFMFLRQGRNTAPHRGNIHLLCITTQSIAVICKILKPYSGKCA